MFNTFTPKFIDLIFDNSIFFMVLMELFLTSLNIGGRMGKLNVYLFL